MVSCLDRAGFLTLCSRPSASLAPEARQREPLQGRVLASLLRGVLPQLRQGMTRLVPILVAVLVWQLVPGLNEVIENAFHLITEGHAAHAFGDDAHSPDDPEHACSGPFHACACHSSQAFVRPPVLDPPSFVALLGGSDAEGSGLSHSDGHGTGLDRPPNA